MEKAARKRGERVPSLQTDPEGYVAWLQQQRNWHVIWTHRAATAKQGCDDAAPEPR